MESIPRALALIPDGNRRWALKHGISFSKGYACGVKKFIDFAEWCTDYGINSISVWAFSTENFRRRSIEREALFNMYYQVATDRSILDKLHENKTKFNVIGNISLIPKKLYAVLHKVEQETLCYKEKEVNMLIAYGGKDDIIHAVNEIVRNTVRDKVKEVSEAMFKSFLFSSSIPEIDFLIRTSGEERLSGLMPWQLGYSELYFSKKLWPDFTRRDLSVALADYKNRHRRFGK